MKNALPIIVVALVIVIGLVFGSRFLPKRGGQVTPPSGVEQEAPAVEEKSFTGRLKDALSLGQSMKCTWKKDEGNFGTAYIKGSKIYTEVTYTGKKAYSIVADNCTYSWEEGKTDGFKLCFEPEERPGEEPGEEPSTEEFAWETADINYSCVKTVVSDSMFNPPANIQFISPLEMMRP